MKFSIVLGAGLLAGAFAGGCKKGGGAKPVTCEVIAAKAGQVTVKGKAAQEMTASQQRNADLIGERVTAALLKVCQDDGWSPELRACLAAAKAGAGPEQCQSMLNPEQRAHAAQAMQRAYAESQQAALDQVVGAGVDMVGALRAVADEHGPEPTCEAIAALALKADAASDLQWVKDAAAANAAVMARVCKEDAWSKEAIACSMTGDEVALCVDKLTPAQLRTLTVEQCKVDKANPGTTCEDLYDRAAAGAPATK
ncbi:MAG: hypothetical protein IPL61_18050 [Myxococcales bacterium]|nr:hypothetical protein [Myxococcales bacterium]